ncbi:1936_t:CDS:1, partial [Racocetra persica]
STCAISHSSELAVLLQKVSFIVWNGVPIMKHHAFETMDQILYDLIKAIDKTLENKLFKDKVVLLEVTFGKFFWW